MHGFPHVELDYKNGASNGRPNAQKMGMRTGDEKLHMRRNIVQSYENGVKVNGMHILNYRAYQYTSPYYCNFIIF